MKIKWNGHASFTITTDDGIVIVTDPYDPSGYDGALQYDMVTDKADVALVSHDHLDHNHVEGLGGTPTVLEGSGEVGNLKVNGIPAYHDENTGGERGSNTIFSFEADGIHTCFVGDLGHQLSPDQIEAIGPVDLLLVPVGGFFTVDAAGAADIAKALGAKLIIPMHFKTEKCGFPIGPVEDFINIMPNVKQINHFEVELSQDKLPDAEPEVWVLTHAC